MRQNHSVYDEKKGILFGCLTKGSDLMEGMIEECKTHGITTGVITCMGSLERAVYVHGVDGLDGKPAYSPKVLVEGPMELLSGTGFFGLNDKDELDLHFHGLIVDKQGMIRGGHFLRGENPILVTLEFSVQVGEGIQAARRFHPKLGFPVMTFQKDTQKAN
jgi:uncharacterized protein